MAIKLDQEREIKRWEKDHLPPSLSIVTEPMEVAIKLLREGGREGGGEDHLPPSLNLHSLPTGKSR